MGSGRRLPRRRPGWRLRPSGHAARPRRCAQSRQRDFRFDTRAPGAETVASQALLWSRVEQTAQRALVNGAAGLVSIRNGRPSSVVGITVKDGKIAEIDILADPQRLAGLDLTILEN